ncbi:hypothetical protein C7S13_4240 [Burkholderia cepacia]|nr:hypothetical protein [Burkholderia cepacia]
MAGKGDIHSRTSYRMQGRGFVRVAPIALREQACRCAF